MRKADNRIAIELITIPAMANPFPSFPFIVAFNPMILKIKAAKLKILPRKNAEIEVPTKKINNKPANATKNPATAKLLIFVLSAGLLGLKSALFAGFELKETPTGMLFEIVDAKHCEFEMEEAISSKPKR